MVQYHHGSVSTTGSCLGTMGCMMHGVVIYPVTCQTTLMYVTVFFHDKLLKLLNTLSSFHKWETFTIQHYRVQTVYANQRQKVNKLLYITCRVLGQITFPFYTLVYFFYCRQKVTMTHDYRHEAFLCRHRVGYCAFVITESQLMKKKIVASVHKPIKLACSGMYCLATACVPCVSFARVKSTSACPCRTLQDRYQTSGTEPLYLF